MLLIIRHSIYKVLSMCILNVSVFYLYLFLLYHFFSKDFQFPTEFKWEWTWNTSILGKRTIGFFLKVLLFYLEVHCKWGNFPVCKIKEREFHIFFCHSIPYHYTYRYPEYTTIVYSLLTVVLSIMKTFVFTAKKSM